MHKKDNNSNTAECEIFNPKYQKQNSRQDSKILIIFFNLKLDNHKKQLYFLFVFCLTLQQNTYHTNLSL